jgi:hypothetical protein
MYQTDFYHKQLVIQHVAEFRDQVQRRLIEFATLNSTNELI